MAKMKLDIKSDMFNTFVSKIETISAIHDTVKIKIDRNTILIYSMLGKGNTMIAFKNYFLKTSEYLNFDEDYSINLIIPNAKKFVKNLNFIREVDKIKIDINYKVNEEDELIYDVRTFIISSGKFKVNWMGGEEYSIRDITKEQLKKTLNPSLKRWSFNLSNQDFTDIKKLSSINSEKIIDMTVSDGIVKFSENHLGN